MHTRGNVPICWAVQIWYILLSVHNWYTGFEQILVILFFYKHNLIVFCVCVCVQTLFYIEVLYWGLPVGVLTRLHALHTLFFTCAVCACSGERWATARWRDALRVDLSFLSLLFGPLFAAIDSLFAIDRAASLIVTCEHNYVNFSLWSDQYFFLSSELFFFLFFLFTICVVKWSVVTHISFSFGVGSMLSRILCTFGVLFFLVLVF